MRRKFITFLLFLLIIFIGRVLFVSQKKIVYIGDICTYYLPAGEVDAKFKTAYRQCQASLLWSMSIGQFNCDSLKKPSCSGNENSTYLCQRLIEKDPSKGPQDLCEADFNCPDDLASYKDLVERCHKK